MTTCIVWTLNEFGEIWTQVKTAGARRCTLMSLTTASINEHDENTDSFRFLSVAFSPRECNYSPLSALCVIQQIVTR